MPSISLQFFLSARAFTELTKLSLRNVLAKLRHCNFLIVWNNYSLFILAVSKVLVLNLMRESSFFTSYYHSDSSAILLLWYPSLKFFIASISCSYSTSKVACSTVLLSKTFKIGYTSSSY